MKLYAKAVLQLTPEEVDKVNTLKDKGIKTIDIFRAGLEKLLTDNQTGVE